MRARPVPEKPDAVQQVPVGYAGGAEDEAPAGREVRGAVHLFQVDAPLEAAFTFAVVARQEPPLDFPAQALQCRDRQHPFGGAARAEHGVDVRSPDGCRNRGNHVAVPDELHPGAGLAHFRYQVPVAFPVEDDDRQVFEGTVEAEGDRVQVRGDGPAEVHLPGGGRPDDDLFHVNVGGLQQAALLGHGDYGHGVVYEARRDARALDRVHRYVHFPGVGPGPADLLADEQHGRLVAFAFAYDYFTVNVELVQDAPHGVRARLVDKVGIALARHPAGRDGGFLGDPHHFKHEVAFKPDHVRVLK